MYTQTKELLALEILKKINDNYQVNARGSEEFEAFIQEKKLDKKIIENFQIGFSSKESIFLQQLTSMEIDILTMVGLIKYNLFKNQIYDFYENRIVFPLHDINGVIRGFSARTLKAERLPKFLNSSDSFIFKRDQILYGYNLAKDHIIRNNQVIITEGFNDVFKMHQEGFRQTVGTLGYALSSNMVRFIADKTSNVVLVMDSNYSSKKAISNISKQFLEIGIKVEFREISNLIS